MSDEKKMYFIMYAGWIAFLLAMWCLLSRGNVPNNQNGNPDIKQELNTAASHQQSAEAGIKRAEELTDSIEAGVDESSRIIKECQRILRQVESRGTITQTKN